MWAQFKIDGKVHTADFTVDVSVRKKAENEEKIPYLHLANTNIGAIKLYEKLGFQTRKAISFCNFIIKEKWHINITTIIRTKGERRFKFNSSSNGHVLPSTVKQLIKETVSDTGSAWSFKYASLFL